MNAPSWESSNLKSDGSPGSVLKPLLFNRSPRGSLDPINAACVVAPRPKSGTKKKPAKSVPPLAPPPIKENSPRRLPEKAKPPVGLCRTVVPSRLNVKLVPTRLAVIELMLGPADEGPKVYETEFRGESVSTSNVITKLDGCGPGPFQNVGIPAAASFDGFRKSDSGEKTDDQAADDGAHVHDLCNY